MVKRLFILALIVCSAKGGIVFRETFEGTNSGYDNPDWTASGSSVNNAYKIEPLQATNSLYISSANEFILHSVTNPLSECWMDFDYRFTNAANTEVAIWIEQNAAGNANQCMVFISGASGRIKVQHGSVLSTATAQSILVGSNYTFRTHYNQASGEASVEFVALGGTFTGTGGAFTSVSNGDGSDPVGIVAPYNGPGVGEVYDDIKIYDTDPGGGGGGGTTNTYSFVEHGFYTFTDDHTGERITNEFTIPLMSNGGPRATNLNIVMYQHQYTITATQRWYVPMNPTDFSASVATQHAGHIVIDCMMTTNENGNPIQRQNDGAYESWQIAQSLLMAVTNIFRTNWNGGIHVGGGSGGGGNQYNTLMKIPNLSRSWFVYFGMDYGGTNGTISGQTNHWYEQHLGVETYMNNHIGGDPEDQFKPYIIGNYLSRSAIEGVPFNLLSSSYLRVYHDFDDTTVRADCSYGLSNAVFHHGNTNIIITIGYAGEYPHTTLHTTPTSIEDSLDDTNHEFGAFQSMPDGLYKCMGFMWPISNCWTITLDITNGVADFRVAGNVFSVTNKVSDWTNNLTITYCGLTTNTTLETYRIITFGSTNPVDTVTGVGNLRGSGIIRGPFKIYAR